MVVDLDLDLCREELAWPLPEADGEVSMDSKAALAKPNGVAALSTGADDFCDSFSATVAALAEPTDVAAELLEITSLGAGVGEGETTDADFLRPPPKKLFRVCCFPLNSSKNFVANLGGSGAVLGGSVG
jgi:hypothetical protein